MLDKLAKRLLQPVNTSVISIMGVFDFVLGFWLILPFNSLSSQYPIGFPEWIIGFITLFIGVLIVFGAVRERLQILSIGALVGFLFWLIATGLAMTTRIESPAWIFTIMISIYHFFVGVNIRVNYSNLRNKN